MKKREMMMRGRCTTTTRLTVTAKMGLAHPQLAVLLHLLVPLTVSPRTGGQREKVLSHPLATLPAQGQKITAVLPHQGTVNPKDQLIHLEVVRLLQLKVDPLQEVIVTPHLGLLHHHLRAVLPLHQQMCATKVALLLQPGVSTVVHTPLQDHQLPLLIAHRDLLEYPGVIQFHLIDEKALLPRLEAEVALNHQ